MSGQTANTPSVEFTLLTYEEVTIGGLQMILHRECLVFKVVLMTNMVVSLATALLM